MKRFHIGAMAATCAAVLVSIGVYAATNTESQNDATAVAQATVSLTQAIATAEQHAHGKASKAEYERASKPGQWVYDVEVVAGACLAAGHGQVVRSAGVAGRLHTQFAGAVAA